MSEEILIDVAPDGNTKIVTRGFRGRSCKQATEKLEKALGAVTKDTPTNEMYQTEEVRTRAQS